MHDMAIDETRPERYVCEYVLCICGVHLQLHVHTAVVMILCVLALPISDMHVR